MQDRRRGRIINSDRVVYYRLIITVISYREGPRDHLRTGSAIGRILIRDRLDVTVIRSRDAFGVELG